MILYHSAGEPMARVPKVAREAILRGTRRSLEINKFVLILVAWEIIEIAIQHFIMI